MLYRMRVWYCFCSSGDVFGGPAFKTLSRMGQTSIPSFGDVCVELRGERILGFMQKGGALSTLTKWELTKWETLVQSGLRI